MNQTDIQSLIDAAEDQPSIHLERRTYVRVPPGVYDISETVVVDKVVDLDMRGVHLYPGQGVDALRVETPGRFSVLSGALIIGDLHDQWSSHGIGLDVQAHGVTARDFFISNMGTGARWWGSAAQGTNANNGRAHGIECFRCREYGLHLKGGDGNAGTFTGINVIGGGKTIHAILDESFLGNVIEGTHASSTLLEAYKVTAVANYGTWSGCYLENDCGINLAPGAPKIASVASRASWVGGNAIFHVKVGDRFGAGMSKAIFVDKTPEGDTLSVTLPHGADYSYMGFRHESGDTSTHPSGGIEMLMRRRRKTGTIDFAPRASGVVRAALSVTRGDHSTGHGKTITSAKVKLGGEHVVSGAQQAAVVIPDAHNDPKSFLPAPSALLDGDIYSTRDSAGTISYVCRKSAPGVYEWVQL